MNIFILVWTDVIFRKKKRNFYDHSFISNDTDLDLDLSTVYHNPQIETKSVNPNLVMRIDVCRFGLSISKGNYST